MRKIIYFVLIIVSCLGCVSCSSEDEYKTIEKIAIKIPKDSIFIADDIILEVMNAPQGSIINWLSSNQDIATIDKSTGTLKALKIGQTTISVSINIDSASTPLTASITVNVLPVKLVGIEISAKNIELPLGKLYARLYYYLLPLKASSDYPVVWSSSDTNIVKVDQRGLLTPISAGTAEIKISVENKFSDGCIITIPKNSFSGYKWGSSIQDVNPTVVQSKYFAFNWRPYYGCTDPYNAFVFNQNKLVSIWHAFDAKTKYKEDQYFKKEIEPLNPPQSIDLYSDNEYNYIKQDSLYWIDNNLHILVRNGVIRMNNQLVKMLIIEYSPLN